MSRTADAGSRPGAAPRSRQPGFTLIELMVTLAVAGILAVVAVPAMTSLINGNRLAGTSGDLTASLQLARSEAIRRNARVTICGTTDGANCSADWSRWIVTGLDNVSGTTDTIRDAAVTGATQVSGPATGIVFLPSGMIAAQETLTACVPTTSPNENQRVITVMISGSIVTTRAGTGAGTCP
ncbi:MAG TPA: GspH/FimT family pseudopilin [Luteimonas sp.]|nr:GspH/FimT family pseudopilin [Luteimonas sp.]HRO26573.1 GspH/FimT family pseudopilin [Luteimonas sp.]HRP72570.1 GspH/FimT family pseudopilin [Luteimonas sp.]